MCTIQSIWKMRSLYETTLVDKNGIPKARIVSGTPGINLTNCCFGGPERKTLFITDSMEGCIQRVEWHCRGALPLAVLRKLGDK